jgi:FlaA1/EpsC-like NDP-sugar epimerase
MESYRRSYYIKALIILIDTLLVAVAFYSSYLIRFDFDIWPEYQVLIVKLLPAVVIVRITALYHAGGYRGLWRYTSIDDLVRLLKGILIGSVLLIGINYFRNYPLSLVAALLFLVSAVVRRSIDRFRASKRVLLLGIVSVFVLVLGGGIYFFTILASAPVSMANLPLGNYLVSQDFQSALAMPRAVIVLEAILCFLLVCGVRVGPRLLREARLRRSYRSRRVLVFGAGDIGENLVRAMVSHPEFSYQPVGFIDDHRAKQRASIHGVPVLGTSRDLAELIERLDVQELLIAITSITESDLREVAAVCWQKRIPVRRVPGFSMLLDGRTGLQHLEEVDIKKLLGRLEVELDPERVAESLRDRVVLVTGAGGSIGSELCRQIGRFAPQQLVLIGRGENSIYHIQKELASLYPSLTVTSVIGDIRNEEKMDYVFRTYRPEVVYHAAAHKHVPFMEENPEEAVLNNVFGTLNVAQAAIRYQVGRFVLISTDKAVALSSVMGASKRLAELEIQRLAHSSTTEFVTVRFGNVLGSRGSVVRLFERQIREGVPVTVTHPEMTRYFMSIPEAVRLVLHSSVVGKNGDLCVLDMGKPVRILELAENMILMAGKKPYEDVDILFTGIRAGEVLSEELLTEEEAHTARKLDKILICRPTLCRPADHTEKLEQLRCAAVQCRREEVRQLIGEILPQYCPEPQVTEVKLGLQDQATEGEMEIGTDQEASNSREKEGKIVSSDRVK